MNKILIILFSALCCFAETNNSNVFVNEDVGIKIIKPTSWHFLGIDEYKAERKKIVLDSKDANRRKNIMTNMPMVILVKHPDDYQGTNTVCEFLVKDISTVKNKSEKELWELILPNFKKMFRDFKLIKKPNDMKISGKYASGIEIEFTFVTQDAILGLCKSQMVIWKKDNFLCQFTATYPSDSDITSLEEIRKIIDNIIRID